MRHFREYSIIRWMCWFQKKNFFVKNEKIVERSREFSTIWENCWLKRRKLKIWRYCLTLFDYYLILFVNSFKSSLFKNWSILFLTNANENANMISIIDKNCKNFVIERSLWLRFSYERLLFCYSTLKIHLILFFSIIIR